MSYFDHEILTLGLCIIPRRHYMAGHGRFLTQVALEMQLEGEHPYGYAHNNPIKYTDPSGLVPCIYGKYCGGCNGPGDPDDDLDRCCQAHDYCLATWKQWVNPIQYKRCQCVLCACAAVANCKWGLKCNAARLVISRWACNSCITPCPLPGL